MDKIESNESNELFAMINGLCDEDESLGYFDRDLDWQSNLLLPIEQIKVEPGTSQSCFLGSTMTLTDNFIRPFLDDDYFDDDFDDDDDDCKNKDKKRKRTRPPNPDAKLIAEATERNLKLLNLDPNSKEGKKQRRKIRNRMSAQMHRERKKAYIDTLEAMVRERNAKILELQEQLRTSKLENECLRGQINVLAPMNTNQPLNTIHSSKPMHLTSMDLPQPAYQHSPTTTHSGVTSDNYDSDGSGGATSISSSSGSNNGLGRFPSLRTGLSLFSIVMMFGFTFLNPSMNIGSSKLTLDSSFMDVYSSTGSSSDTSLLPLPSSAGEDLYTSDHRSYAGNGAVGRVLLSSTYSTNSIDNPINKPGPVFDTFKPSVTVPNAAFLPSPSTALWKYQDRIVQLFPRDLKDKQDMPPKVAQRNRNLRARSPKLVSTARALVLSHAGRPEKLAEAEEPVATLMDSDVSHVVMTHGRALLDKSLITTNVPGTPGRVFPGEKRSGTVLSSWTGRRSNWPTLALQSTQFDSAIAATSLVPAPLLVMLLPASVVRWGKTWGESGSFGPLDDLLKDEAAGKWGDQDDVSALWVEIACTVVSAQIVRNVTLV